MRLDKDLGDLLSYLDSKVGKDQYLVFLSADHGVAHVPDYLKSKNIPAGKIELLNLRKQMNIALRETFKDSFIVSSDNYQLYLNHQKIDSLKLDIEVIKKWVIKYLLSKPEVARAFALDKLVETTLNAVQKNMLVNGYYPRRSGDVQIILQPNVIEGFINSGTTHGGSWNPYDAHIPLLWYGWGIKKGKTNREVQMTDIAPTVSAMLHIQMPNGCVGKVIEEVMK